MDLLGYLGTDLQEIISQQVGQLVEAAMSEKRQLHPLQELARDIMGCYRHLTNLAQRPGTEVIVPGVPWVYVVYMREIYLLGPQSNADLARVFCVSRQAMSLAMGKLAEQGLVEYAPNPRHKTARLITLAEDGVALVERHIDVSREVAAMFEERIAPDTVKALREMQDLLHRIESITEDEDWVSIIRDLVKDDN